MWYPLWSALDWVRYQKRRLFRTTRERESVIDPDWHTHHGWFRVCYQCLPLAIQELSETERPDCGWSWEGWLVWHDCDRCGIRFRRYAELFAMDGKALDEELTAYRECEHDWKENDDTLFKFTCSKCHFTRSE